MRTMLLAIALFVCSNIIAQDIPASQVPAAVKNTLKAKFPKNSGLDWEKKGALYEADFDVNMIDHKALLDATGKLIAFKKDIRSSQLPAAVRNTIKTHYKGCRIDDAESVEKNGVVFYQVDLDGKPQDQKLVIRADGKVDPTEPYWD